MSIRGLYRMTWDAGRNGTLSGLFTATETEVAAAIGKDVDFGEALGKHSHVHGKLEASEVHLLTNDADFVAKFDAFKCASGYNPLQYMVEE